VNYQNYQNLMLLTSSDTKRTHVASILVNKIHPKRTGFNIYAEYTRLKLTFLALHPWLAGLLGLTEFRNLKRELVPLYSVLKTGCPTTAGCLKEIEYFLLYFHLI